MVNLDKLLKSFENLKAFHSGIGSDDPLSSSNKLKTKDSTISKKDKLLNCNNIADIISSNQIKSSPDFPKFLSLSVELFLCLCDDSEPDVRIVADECINRVTKSLLDSNVSRLQVELYKEVKKNEASRSLRAALLKFADLCHYIKPQKCRPYMVNLLPCLTKISQRNDEGIQDCLATSMFKICPVLMSFATDLETKMLMKSFLSNAKSPSPNTRRSAAICLALICSHSRKPRVSFQWLADYLIERLSSAERVEDTRTLHGLLLILRHLLLHLPDLPRRLSDRFHVVHECVASNCDLTPSCMQVLKMLEIILEFMNHSDHNIINTGLECFFQLFKNIHPQFLHLLVSPGLLRNLLAQKSDAECQREDTETLKTPDMPFPPELTSDLIPSPVEATSRQNSDEDHFSCHAVEMNDEDVGSTSSENVKESEEEATLDVSAAIQAVESFENSGGDVGELSDEDEVPIVFLARFLCSKFLLSGIKGGLVPDKQVRVSIKVLALHSISLLLHFHPNTLLLKLHKRTNNDNNDMQDIRDVLLYVSHSDPQLKGNVALLIGAFISSEAACTCSLDGESPGSTCEVEKLVSMVMEIYDDESSVAARCAVRALESSLPSLMEGSHGHAALNALLSLLKFKANCYWLVKVEILQLLSTLNFKILSFLGRSADAKKGHSRFKVDGQEMVIENVMTLLGDEDHRVRQAAVNIICRMIPQLFYAPDELQCCPLVALAAQTMLGYLPGSSLDSKSRCGKHSGMVSCHEMESALSRIITRIMRCFSQSSNKNFTLGCCSALCQLSEEYRVQDFVGAWLSLFKHPASPVMQPHNLMQRILPRSKSSNGVSTLPSGHSMNNDDWSMTLVGGPLLFILSTLTSSPMSHDLHFHSDAIKLAGNLFIGTSTHNLKGQGAVCSDTPHNWSILSDKFLTLLGDKLLIHVLRMLNIFHHIIEDVIPNSAQSKSLPSLPTPPSLSPIKRKPKVGKESETLQGRPTSTNQDKPPVKEPIKEGLGSFTNIQHYLQLYSVLKSAYMSFKISAELTSDKFLHTLKSTLTVLSQLLELATLNEVSRCADELLSYLASTFALEPSVSLICVRQLLRSIFGTNMASEEGGHFGNRQQISTSPSSQLLDSLKLYDVCFKLPMIFLYESGSSQQTDEKKSCDRIQPALMAKIFSKSDKSSVGSYIKLFEPLVIRALKQYTLTSLPEVQLHVLDLLTTLVQLRVNYCLLDSDQHSEYFENPRMKINSLSQDTEVCRIFIGFVLKQIELIETGQSRATDGLLPQIFNFLIHLSFEKYHNKGIITMSKVIQLCDGIIASELEPSLYAVPCLKHIVSALFSKVSDSRQSDPKELETQREVVVSMLLKLLRFCEVLDMLNVVLRHAEGEDRLNKLSRQISDYFFPALMRQEIQIENAEDLNCVINLFESLSPCVFRPIDILVNILFTVPSTEQKQDTKLCRWLAQALCCLRTLLTLDDRKVVLVKITQMRETPPLFSFPSCQLFVKSPLLSSLKNIGDDDDAGVEESGELILSRFMICLVVNLMSSIQVKPVSENQRNVKFFLCQEMFHLLLLLEKMLYTFPEVLISMRELMTTSAQLWLQMTNDFLKLLTSHPPLLMRWCSIIIIVIPKNDYLRWWRAKFPPKLSKISANMQLVRETGFLLICQRVVENGKEWTSAIEWMVDDHFEDVVKFSCEEIVQKLLSLIQSDAALSRKLCRTVKNFYEGNQLGPSSVSFIRRTLKCLETTHPRAVGEMLKLLVTTFLSTCYFPITKAADRLACRCAEVLLATEVDQCKQLMTLVDIKKLTEHLKTLNLKKNHLSSLLSKLEEHLREEGGLTLELHSEESMGTEDDNMFGSDHFFAKEEYLKMVKASCLKTENKSSSCPQVLASLDYSSILSIFMSEDCSPLLLSSCIEMISSQSRSARLSSRLRLSSSSRATASSMQMFKAASFAIQRNINKVVNLLPIPYRFFDSKNLRDPHAVRTLELFSDHELFRSTAELARAVQAYLEFLSLASSFSSLDEKKKLDIQETDVKDICRFCIFYLELVHWHMQHGCMVSSLDLMPSLSCLNLCLSIEPINNHFSAPENFLYVCTSVHIVHALLSGFVAHPEGVLTGPALNDHPQMVLDELNLTTRTCDLMCELILCLSTHLHNPPSSSNECLPLYLRAPFRKLVVALGRIPLVNSYARTPSLVWTMGWSPTPTGGNKTKLPPIPLEFLQDKDVLSDYIFRVSAIGWTNRHQFEETWMSLLAVLNPVTHEDAQLSHEECLEKTQCQILSMRAITSLILSTTLAPSPGNPSVSFFKHKPRNELLSFFRSNNGQKLLRVKMKLEMDLWGLVSDERVEFEGTFPLTSNSEKEIGDLSFSPSQLSTSYIISMLGDAQESSIIQMADATPTLNTNGYQQLESETVQSSNLEIMAPSDLGFPSPTTSSQDIDIRSCLQFLLELYSSFLASSSSSPSSSSPLSPTPKIPLNLLNETVRSILLLSDVFTDRAQYEWVLMMMLDITRCHPMEDELLACYVVLATCKAAAVVGLDAVLFERIVKLVDMNLRSTHLPTKIFTLYGGLYILEANQGDLLSSLISIFVDYLLKSLSGFTPSTIHSQQHALVMWSLSFYILENFHDQVKDLEFPAKFYQICTSMISTYQDSTPLPIFSCILTGLERLAISQSLDLECLVKLATERFCQQNTQRSLMAFNLMVTCMYVDFLKPKEQANMREKDEEKKDFMSDADASMKIMERVTVIFDRVRKGLPREATTIMKVLPLMLVDFFEGHEIMNKIIVEFLSNQQPQTQLFARLLFQVFEHLSEVGQSQLVINWVMLSLSNFTQKTPLAMAVWSLTCVFICSSGNHWLRSIFPLVIRRVGLMEQMDVHLFKTSAINFYKNLLTNNESHAESFLVIFQAVAPLHPDAPYKELLDSIKTLKF